MKKNIIITIFLIVIIAIISGVIAYKSGLTKNGIKKGCTQEAKICPDGSAVGRIGSNCEFAACPAGGKESQTLNYNNEDYNFSFSYPERDVFNPVMGYQYVTNNSLARVDLPQSDFAGTNLGEASFIVGANSDNKIIDVCLKSADEESATSSIEIINGTEMKVFNGVGVGAGNIYETKSYRAVKNGVCYEATLLLHSGNIWNYTPGAVKEFDHEKFLNSLMEILNTLKISDKADTTLITEAEARAIAEKTCIKGGESLSSGHYNENSKTWWFDANLNATQERCNPACVVSEATKSAEINWRCTGLKEPAADQCECPSGYRKEGDVCNPECYYSTPPCLAPSFSCQKKESAEEIKDLFVKKYPKYAKTLSISVDKETANYARGSVSFENGAPGGIFLATKIDGKWQIVFDGNGQISCNLSKYGFPSEMLSDCN